MDERKVYTLLQVSEAVKRRIEEAAAGGWYWVRAEIAGLRTPNHAYLELVEHRQGRKRAGSIQAGNPQDHGRLLSGRG